MLSMKYLSLFSGVGGFEIGIERAMPNAQCVGFSEIDKYASAVLKCHFPKVPNYGDVQKINWSEVPDFDLLVGGSPCQDFSVAGERKGITGQRSGLFYSYIEALRHKTPKYFIWENVKGVLSSNEGRDFAIILNQMAEAGYSLQWQVLNAKDFGVPQNRERVFVIGTRGDSQREVFFERQNEENSDAGDRESQGRDTIGSTLTGRSAGGGNCRGNYIRYPLRFLGRNQKNIEGDYAFTVDASQTSGVSNGERIRRLTPLECERLMGWPDNWTRYGCFCKGECGDASCSYNETISDNQRYKMCGNGVVSNVVEAIIRELFKV